MAIADRNGCDAAARLARIVSTDGSAGHAAPVQLACGDALLRDIADALHQLCSLHGRHPGVVDYAARADPHPAADAWFEQAAAAFAEERAYLIRVSAAAGPPPGTPGQAATEAALAAQRHAIDLLARSVRPGCALGAAIGITLDWPAIRRPLDAAALRLGLDTLPNLLPSPAQTMRLIDTVTGDSPVERAMTFGLQQLLAQHRGLWDLLIVRAESRG
ncbi:DUF6975 family protein [Sphingomonas hankookensis]|uniref:Uncharacterized protein n=1 Tax=Sphingomonas hengshuiensis TaxID=1609977 RepID=A0A2W4ZHG5_9SPHN|nr:MAG: hypothetical protein DI632_01775 [Sphingomonas hengshuiensis]